MNLHTKILFLFSLFCCTNLIAKISYFNNEIYTDSIGGTILTRSEINKIFTDDVLNELEIQYPIFRIYSFSDKECKQYIIFTENVIKGNIEDEHSLKKNIKAFNISFLKDKQLKINWTITDFIDETEKSIGFWTRYLSLTDIDNDGYIDPIIVYGTKSLYGEDFEEGRVKILIYYLGKKIAIRHQNSTIDDGRHTQIDKTFFNLPTKIKKKVYDIILSLEENGHSLFNTETIEEIRKSLKN